MKISILINHYDEPEQTIKRLLQSIELQIGVDLCKDVEIIICSDGYDNILSKSFIKSFRYPIIYIAKEYSGVCLTRNVLLDHASGDYIMYCDADDMFIRMDALSLLIKKCYINLDVIVTRFLEETSKGLIPRIQDRYFLHGKLFRRQFLKDNAIRFNEEFSFSGDPWFINLAMQLANKSKYIDEALYLWKNNPESITRKNKLHYYKNYDLHLKCDILLIEEYLKRNRLDLAKYTASFLFITSYYDMTCAAWYELENEERKDIEQHFKQYYTKYRYLFDSFDESKINILANKRYLSDVFAGKPDRDISFKDWINYILRR
jgi:glycosyltransferase involved in cell wall biosynthesis